MQHASKTRGKLLRSFLFKRKFRQRVHQSVACIRKARRTREKARTNCVWIRCNLTPWNRNLRSLLKFRLKAKFARYAIFPLPTTKIKTLLYFLNANFKTVPRSTAINSKNETCVVRCALYYASLSTSNDSSNDKAFEATTFQATKSEPNTNRCVRFPRELYSASKIATNCKRRDLARNSASIFICLSNIRKKLVDRREEKDKGKVYGASWRSIAYVWSARWEESRAFLLAVEKGK